MEYLANQFVNKMKKSFFIFISINFVFSSFSYATEISDFINKSKCDQVINKQLYEICYSYKYKGALSGWVKLDGNLVEKKDIKKRPRFYNENTIPIKYRTKYKDYIGYGEDWNRGHFIVSDADFDYDEKALLKTYTMANIIPMSSIVNQKIWTKVERYGRMLSQKLGYINSISIAKYDNINHKIGNNIVIPTNLYRIYYNNDTRFEKCFTYLNKLNINYKNDKLKNHEIDCNLIKLSRPKN
jgi:endonuclease G, mitochondrial